MPQMGVHTFIREILNDVLENYQHLKSRGVLNRGRVQSFSGEEKVFYFFFLQIFFMELQYFAILLNFLFELCFSLFI